MISCEQDPDLVRWGLQLFDGDLYSYHGYGEAVAQNSVGHNNEQYFKEDFYDTAYRNAENGGLVMHALQEDLSQLSVSEATECRNQGIENFETYFRAPEWFNQPVGSYAFGSDNVLEEANDVAPPRTCSITTRNSNCGEEWSYPLEPMDQFVLDVEVGRRLNQMVPIPHVPRINGEIPSTDEATLDHQRLLDRLQVYQLVESKVQGDGNCQFRALSDQFYRTPEHHKFVRQQIINQLKSYPETYEGYVPMPYNEYLEKMSGNGEWGDHVTLQAAADSYGVKIFVITSFKDTCYIEILPSIEKSNRVILLSFWAEVHYNSIYIEGDLPAAEIKKKKRRGALRNNHLKLTEDHRID